MQSSTKIHDQFQYIEKLVKSGDVQAACHQLEVLLPENSSFIQGWRKLGKLYRQIGQRAQALIAFQNAANLDPKHLFTRIDIAVELRELEEFSRALQILTEILHQEPQHPQALYQIGETYRRQHNRPQAIHYFSQAIAADPKYIQAYIQSAHILRESGAFEQATQKLHTALTFAPNHMQVSIQLGLLEKRQGNLDSALHYFQQAYEANPDHLSPKLQTVDALRSFGYYEQAEEKLNQLRCDHSDEFRTLSQLGMLEYHRHRFDQALNWFKQSQKVANQPSQKKQTQVWIIKVLREQNHLDEAFSALEPLLAQFPKDIELKMISASLYQRQFNFAAAEKTYKAILQIAPSHLNARLALARLLENLNQVSAALELLEATTEFPADTLALQLKQIEILRRWHHLDDAEAKLEKALRVNQDAQLLMQLGHLRRQQGQRRQALHQFRQAQKLAVHNDQALNAQLLAIEELRELGQLENAQQELSTLLQQRPYDYRPKMLMASILRRQSNLVAAAKIYQEILEQTPHALDVLLELATVLSETEQVSIAVRRLAAQYQAASPHFGVLMKLGYLTRANDGWEQARYWFESARNFYPHKFQVYVALSEVMYHQGEMEAALRLLIDAMQQFPDTPELPLKLAQLNLRLGYPKKTYTILKQALKRFPSNFSITLQLCRLHLQLGKFEQVAQILDKLDSDQSSQLKQIEHLRGQMALYQLKLEEATHHYQRAIQHSPTNPQEHEQLAQSLMLMGELDQAYKYLKIATDQLKQRRDPGNATIPIKNHIAALINQLRMNPPLLDTLQKARQEMDDERLRLLASIVAQEPSYLGASIYLAKEFRQQKIFSNVRQALSIETCHLPQIPKRIVQFWDALTPPVEIQQVAHSWSEVNPGYEYTCFSFQSAVNFIHQHYDDEVLKAFQYCEHPATQADLFRLAYLNKMGGFYADADDRCLSSLDPLVKSNAELVVYQEHYASIGNNFLGCVPDQPIIRSALYQAVSNLLKYTTEGPWLTTGPGLMTVSVCSGLLPYLTYTDYRMWPRLVVLSQEELRSYLWPHLSLPYKKTAQSWRYATYRHKKDRNYSFKSRI